MTVMRIIRAVYTGLAVAVLVALLSGRDDPPTNLCISVSSLVIIALVAWWSWLRDRRDRPPPVPNRIPGGLFKEKSPMHDGSPDHQPHSPTGPPAAQGTWLLQVHCDDNPRPHPSTRHGEPWHASRCCRQWPMAPVDERNRHHCGAQPGTS